ncbi:MAG: hypothetical protein EOO01_28470 [Chitinophagaceae bacterium]|nr:MAG: hypothetical protein EOO01_28470 [Chitinophagaceae bacterium]
MILIISNSRNEPSTDAVIDWLTHFQTDFVRINTDDLTIKENETAIRFPDDNLLHIAGRTIDLSEINVVWYRRWYDYSDIPFKTTNANERKLFREVIAESDNLMYYLCGRLKDKKWLSNPLITRFHNKQNALYAAIRNGLNIPDTIITTQKKELKEFIKKHGEVITKPIGDPSMYMDHQGNGYKSYTQVITPEMAEKLPTQFYLSQFQRKIDAAYEIRSFYLDGQFFSTAIMGSITTDIKLSVRIAHATKFVIFKFPAEIEEKLDKTMRDLNLNSASIDVMRGHDGRYYFLEANPVGQFSGYGAPCNYYLDKKIAEWLVQHDTSSKQLPNEKETKTIHRHPVGQLV